MACSSRAGAVASRCTQAKSTRGSAAIAPGDGRPAPAPRQSPHSKRSPGSTLTGREAGRANFSERRNAGEFWAADQRVCRVWRRRTLLGCSRGAGLAFIDCTRSRSPMLYSTVGRRRDGSYGYGWQPKSGLWPNPTVGGAWDSCISQCASSMALPPCCTSATIAAPTAPSEAYRRSAACPTCPRVTARRPPPSGSSR